MAQEIVVQALLEQIAKHWGWEVGDKVRAEIQSVINAHNVDLEQLRNAIQTIQGLLDADPDTPEFDVGQNIIRQLTDHLTRITNLEGDVNTLKGDESVVGSVAYAVKQERDRATAAEQALDQKIDNTKAALEQADAELQAQIDEIVGGSSGTSLSGLKTEVDNIEAGVGLNDDGTYTANTSTNYIDEATSVVDATEKLDAKLKEVDDRVVATEADLAVLKGDENTAGSVANQVAAAKTEAMSYADQVAQEKANEAKEAAKSEVFDAIAAINANTLASIFRQALDCGFSGKPKDDVLNGAGDCAAAGGNSADNGEGGDGAVI